MTKHYAHSLENQPPHNWEPLEDHLRQVAKLASEFAAKFDAGEWGYLAGLWHDLGKYSEPFQTYLRQENGIEAHLEGKQGRVDHSTAGAKHAQACINPWGKVMAYVIAGHHAGLPNSVGGMSSLQGRLRKQIEPIQAAPTVLLEYSKVLPNPKLTTDVRASPSRVAYQLSLFTRMLFSCLVDADFLATEAFLTPARSAKRSDHPLLFASMRTALDERLSQLGTKQIPTLGRSTVNACRQEVLDSCRAAATGPPGLFSLTVPTGGGKTLASLAFALDHVIEHNLDRIIYVIPFTSIIEQTGSVFREVFARLGDDIVLEHHSNVDPDSAHATPRSRLAAENWDAPLVVTTNVQLFESLFAARTSSCRKLHNLVGSVIILDEAQTLPVGLLRPVTAVINELIADYHCTVVLCTATQPAIGYREEFQIGLKNIREVVPDPETLYRRMRRVTVQTIGRPTDVQLVTRLTETPSFLVIVNTRAHAARLFNLLREGLGDCDDIYHLSTLLCGQHRSKLLHTIRKRLADELPCRVVSTQLIEAGVDVDFPVVFRAMTGLDSLAQAAGRCNREGKLPNGSLYLFDPVDCQPKGYLGSVATTARELLPDFQDLLALEAIERYFQLHYWKHVGEHQWDDRDVMSCFPEPPQRFAFDFRTAAERFRMIEDATKTIFVPYEKGRGLVERLRSDGPSRALLRRLQRFSVGVYEEVYAHMVGSDVEELRDGGYAVLINEDLYDEQLGLRVDRLGLHEPERLIF